MSGAEYLGGRVPESVPPQKKTPSKELRERIEGTGRPMRIFWGYAKSDGRTLWEYRKDGELIQTYEFPWDEVL